MQVTPALCVCNKVSHWVAVLWWWLDIQNLCHCSRKHLFITSMKMLLLVTSLQPQLVHTLTHEWLSNVPGFNEWSFHVVLEVSIKCLIFCHIPKCKHRHSLAISRGYWWQWCCPGTSFLPKSSLNTEQCMDLEALQVLCPGCSGQCKTHGIQLAHWCLFHWVPSTLHQC